MVITETPKPSAQQIRAECLLGVEVPFLHKGKSRVVRNVQMFVSNVFLRFLSLPVVLLPLLCMSYFT